MEEVYIDLSDNIFIHKDFIEIVNLKIIKGKTLIESLEQYVFDKKDKVIIFQNKSFVKQRLSGLVIFLVFLSKDTKKGCISATF